MTTRVCTKCKIEKYIGNFEHYKNGKKNKIRNICNECLKEIRSAVTKICSKCGFEKPVCEYSKNSKCADFLDSRCKQCVSEYHRDYYLKNSDKVCLHVKNYRGANPEVIKARKKKYVDDNREYVLEWYRKYYARNSDALNEYQRKRYEENTGEYMDRIKKYLKTPEGRATKTRSLHKRRLGIKQTACTLTAKQWSKILEMQNNKCADCGREFCEKSKPTKDHIIPLSLGGPLTFGNVQALCKSCNSIKNNRVDFIRGAYEILVVA